MLGGPAALSAEVPQAGAQVVGRYSTQPSIPRSTPLGSARCDEHALSFL